jgi:uncharacterized protein YkwD
MAHSEFTGNNEKAQTQPGTFRATATAALAMVAAALLTAVTISAPGADAATGIRLNEREARLVRLTNHARLEHGLPRLHVRADLVRHARRHTRAMIADDRLYHSPDLASLCCWRYLGENVGYGPTVRAVHRALLASGGHRANILDRGYRHLGVGVVRTDGRVWVTEIFRQPG